MTHRNHARDKNPVFGLIKLRAPPEGDSFLKGKPSVPGRRTRTPIPGIPFPPGIGEFFPAPEAGLSVRPGSFPSGQRRLTAHAASLSRPTNLFSPILLIHV